MTLRLTVGDAVGAKADLIAGDPPHALKALRRKQFSLMALLQSQGFFYQRARLPVIALHVSCVTKMVQKP